MELLQGRLGERDMVNSRVQVNSKEARRQEESGLVKNLGMRLRKPHVSSSLTLEKGKGEIFSPLRFWKTLFLFPLRSVFL